MSDPLICPRCSTEIATDSPIPVFECPSCGQSLVGDSQTDAAPQPGQPPVADESASSESKAPGEPHPGSDSPAVKHDQTQAEPETVTEGEADQTRFDPQSVFTDSEDAEDLTDIAALDGAQDEATPDFLAPTPADDSDDADDQSGWIMNEMQAGAADSNGMDETVVSRPRTPDEADPTVNVPVKGFSDVPLNSEASDPEAATVMQAAPDLTFPAVNTGPPPTSPQPPADAPAGKLEAAAASDPPPARRGAKATVSKTLFIAVASYASAVTIVVIYLLMNRAAHHALESLPDLKPLQENEFKIVPLDAHMAPQHSLKLGDSGGRRFGNIVLRPLKVTREPVEFEYFTDTLDVAQRPPTKPVLKLWLELENVSRNQVFSPLDARLLSHEYFDDKEFTRHSHQFVRTVDNTSDLSRVVHAMSRSEDDPWNMKGQNLGRALKPGESCVMYIATEEEGTDGLEGNLVWRLQFRKGFHEATRHGVTTLVEIEFNTDQIETGTSETGESQS